MPDDIFWPFAGQTWQQSSLSSVISHLESFSLEPLAIPPPFPLSRFLDADCTNSNSSTLLTLTDNSVMLASCAALRATRIQPIFRATHYLESTARPRNPRLSDKTNGVVVGGLVGGGFVAILSYVCCYYSGASTIVSTAYSAEKKYEDTLKKSMEKMPEPNEATQWLRETATSYAGFIPGGNTAFSDIEAV
jgi:hypothetical protein